MRIERTNAGRRRHDQKKVRDYLENLLDEDRKLKDTQQIKSNWQPKKNTLSPKDWAIVQVRAADKATP
jgi:hypothetical protein